MASFWGAITGADAKAKAARKAAKAQKNATLAAQQAASQGTQQAAQAAQVAQDQALATQQAATDQALVAQQQGTQQGLAAQSAQFGQARDVLNPYSQAGSSALQQQQNILGLGGADAQQSAYTQIQNSPAFKALSQAGQDAILANASATGGVRGGNTQGALAQFGTQNLANLLEQQYGQLSGLSQMGYGAAGQQSGLYGQQGQLEANLLAGGGANQANLLASGGANQAGMQFGGGQTLANLLYGAGNTQAGYAQDLGAIKAGSILGQQKAYGDADAAFWGGLGTLAGGLGGAFLGGPMGAAAGASLFGGKK